MSVASIALRPRVGCNLPTVMILHEVEFGNLEKVVLIIVIYDTMVVSFLDAPSGD